MLVGLEKVAWSELDHAYGAAVDVPEILRGLDAANPATREAADARFNAAIVHQGTWYTATVAVVPFLVQIAATTDDPAWRSTVIASLSLLCEEAWEPRLQHADNARLYPAMRAALAAAVPALLRLVESHRDDAMACHAVLGLLEDQGTASHVVEATLREAFAADHPAVRAAGQAPRRPARRREGIDPRTGRTVAIVPRSTIDWRTIVEALGANFEDDE